MCMKLHWSAPCRSANELSLDTARSIVGVRVCRLCTRHEAARLRIGLCIVGVRVRRVWTQHEESAAARLEWRVFALHIDRNSVHLRIFPACLHCIAIEILCDCADVGCVCCLHMCFALNCEASYVWVMSAVDHHTTTHHTTPKTRVTNNKHLTP